MEQSNSFYQPTIPVPAMDLCREGVEYQITDLGQCYWPWWKKKKKKKKMRMRTKERKKERQTDHVSSEMLYVTVLHHCS